MEGDYEGATTVLADDLDQTLPTLYSSKQQVFQTVR
jgi:hypothetical protein